MANLAKYWNPKPKTGISQIYELFVALKLAYCIQNPNVFLEFVDGRPIYHFCLHGLLLSKLWIVSNESGGCSVGGSHAQRRDSWFCHHQEFWYCRVFYSIYFNFYIWTEGMNRIYAWMNRLLLEATLCSVPVFCIWPFTKKASQCTANTMYQKDSLACKRCRYCTVHHRFWTITAGINYCYALNLYPCFVFSM